MTNKHFFATHALGYAKAETREEAIKALMGRTDPKWVNNCLKDGSLLTVFTCQVNCPVDEGYRIEWFCPTGVEWQDGENYFVTYLTRTKHAVMRDPSDLLTVKVRQLEEQLEQAQAA